MTVQIKNDFTYSHNTRTYHEGEIIECKNLYNRILVTNNEDKDYILEQATEVITTKL